MKFRVRAEKRGAERSLQPVLAEPLSVRGLAIALQDSSPFTNTGDWVDKSTARILSSAELTRPGKREDGLFYENQGTSRLSWRGGSGLQLGFCRKLGVISATDCITGGKQIPVKLRV